MKFLPRSLLLVVIATPAIVAAETPAKPSDTTTTEKTEKSAKLTATELQVVAHYHAVNQLEVELGKAAMKNAGSKDVKSYGDMLVKEHTAEDKKLQAFVKKTGQTIPAEKPPSDVEKQAKAEEKASATKLKTMKGADFDREYLRMMVQGHEKELAMIDAKRASVTNTELSSMIEALQPMFQHHADAARELQVKEAKQPSASR